MPPDPGGVSVGFELLDTIGALLPATKVIVVTGREEREHAVRAVSRGAYDFYQKPIGSDTLNFVVERAFRLWELESDNRRLAQLSSRDTFQGLVAVSPAMISLTRQVERVAPADATVLILGETGTGKEVTARAIHHLSACSQGPFVAINCAAIPEGLLESELFGYEKGAFTGAANRKAGKIEAANGGTLLLDEIGDMPMALQSKILRFLQERTLERLGGNTEIPVDVRVICATHRDLKEMIAQGSFREDLYYRIGEVALNLPPLRERSGDVVVLATELVNRYRMDQALRLSKQSIAALEAWRWPGNIRELENRVKRACIMAEGRLITPLDLELSVESEESPLNLREVRARAEREAILRALSHSRDNISHAARLLGISRPTLYNLFNKHGLSVETNHE